MPAPTPHALYNSPREKTIARLLADPATPDHVKDRLIQQQIASVWRIRPTRDEDRQPAYTVPTIAHYAKHNGIAVVHQ